MTPQLIPRNSSRVFVRLGLARESAESLGSVERISKEIGRRNDRGVEEMYEGESGFVLVVERGDWVSTFATFAHADHCYDAGNNFFWFGFYVIIS